MIATLQRPNLIEPIGMRLASNYILEICKKNNLNIDFYDLYSCFPVAIQMFAKSLESKRSLIILLLQEQCHLLEDRLIVLFFIPLQN